MITRKTIPGLAALVLLFIIACWPFMKRLGIEVDEALLGNGIYEHGAAWYSWHLFGLDLPVMLLSYVGALKTWLYNPWFLVWPPGALSLRLPMVVVGAVTIVLFFAFLDKAAGRRAAWMGTALLATDPTFILTESIDFGFVALQHAFKMGALLLLIGYQQRPSSAKLAGACFLLGLGMWDKAVFAWILASIVVAGAAVFWREMAQHISVQNVTVAGTAFLLGALPLIIYNVARPLETFRQNAHLAPDNPQIKLILLKRTIDGSGLFGYVTAPDSGPHPGWPHGWLERSAFALSNALRSPARTWMMWAFIATLPGVFLIWRTPARRPLAFALLFLVLTWLQMFFTAGAGGAVHHVVLLWPFHLFVVAVVISGLTCQLGLSATRGLRAAPLGLAFLLCAGNLLVVNQYYVTVIRNGPGVRWTDAFSPLAEWLQKAHSPRIITADWGILETLNLLSEGELPVQDASFALRTSGDPEFREVLASMLAAPDTLWVTHAAAAEQWSGVNLNLIHFASAHGYSKELLHTVHDRNGRSIFEILRFRHSG